TLSLHDALPISRPAHLHPSAVPGRPRVDHGRLRRPDRGGDPVAHLLGAGARDRPHRDRHDAVAGWARDGPAGAVDRPAVRQVRGEGARRTGVGLVDIVPVPDEPDLGDDAGVAAGRAAPADEPVAGVHVHPGVHRIAEQPAAVAVLARQRHPGGPAAAGRWGRYGPAGRADGGDPEQSGGGRGDRGRCHAGRDPSGAHGGRRTGCRCGGADPAAAPRRTHGGDRGCRHRGARRRGARGRGARGGRRGPLTVVVPAVRTASTATYAAFIALGFAFASWASRIPQVQEALGLSPQQLGLVLLALAAGSTLALPLAGLVVHHIGARRTVQVMAVVNAVSLAVVAIGHQFGVVPLVVGLFGFGFGQGGWDVAMNVHGADVERGLGRSIMARYHAGFSVSTVA